MKSGLAIDNHFTPQPYQTPATNQRLIMANSQYEYVKKFEQHTPLLPSTFIVVRIDGRGFHRFVMIPEFGMMPLAPDLATVGFQQSMVFRNRTTDAP